MLWALLALVLIFWLVGFTAHVAGGLIHLLLVVALVMWWGASAHLAIPLVWLASAVVPGLLADGPRVWVDRGSHWGWSIIVAYALAGAFVGMGVWKVERRFRSKRAKIPMINDYLQTVTLPEAIGGFIVSALLITLSGATGLFARVMDRIPQPLAAGLLGGTMAVMTRLDPAYYPWRLELIRMELLAGTLPALTVTAHFIANWRTRLIQQRQALRVALERVQQLATRDTLTGLVNRRHMQDLLEQEWQRQERLGEDGHLLGIDGDLGQVAIVVGVGRGLVAEHVLAVGLELGVGRDGEGVRL